MYEIEAEPTLKNPRKDREPGLSTQEFCRQQVEPAEERNLWAPSGKGGGWLLQVF